MMNDVCMTMMLFFSGSCCCFFEVEFWGAFLRQAVNERETKQLEDAFLRKANEKDDLPQRLRWKSI